MSRTDPGSVDRRRRRSITRAVRLGQVMPDAADARIAVERAIKERRSLRSARWVFAGLALLGAAGIVVEIVGGSGFFLAGLWLMSFGVLALLYFVPRRDRYLSRAEELNRAVVDRGPEAP